ncbi:MAG: SUMF1/EgtB/PvdO family nonheme iron enzyme [Muribaculaceae bacterium]|nr:SUMF1/EgtB/PvdO family nonheme iron enzyme [Muribaculaceae bacterium]
MLVNQGGKIVAAYNLSQEVDSLTFVTYDIYSVSALSSNLTLGSASVSSKSVEQGSTVTLTAQPIEGYKFSNWTVNGVVVSTLNPYTTNVTDDIEFVANFEKQSSTSTIIDPISSLSYDELVYVEGGTFTMGAISDDSDERPTHSVTLSSYYIGKYEVTQQLWEYVMSYSGTAADGTTMTTYSSDVWLGTNPSSSYGLGNYYPAYRVSYDDIVNIFLPRLNKITGGDYRLPTEAEWEYAARGGNKSKGYKYSGSNTVGDVAWYYDNSDSKSHPVGTKQANELDIYDMSGNVWEWCNDWYGSSYYSSSPQTNPTGPSTGSARVTRGGNWYYYAVSCRVSNRSNSSPDYRGYVGFRLASSLKP